MALLLISLASLVTLPSFLGCMSKSESRRSEKHCGCSGNTETRTLTITLILVRMRGAPVEGGKQRQDRQRFSKRCKGCWWWCVPHICAVRPCQSYHCCVLSGHVGVMVLFRSLLSRKIVRKQMSRDCRVHIWCVVGAGEECRSVLGA